MQVRATNDEGTGAWSDSGEGSTSSPNRAPAFPDDVSTTLDVNENTAAGTAFGDAVTATDPDGDTLAYSLTDADAASFEIDSATGQLKTKAALDYEAIQNTYTVTVTASDGSLSDTVSVDIAVNDVDEPPGKPSTPTVGAASEDSDTSLAVSWTAPTNTGPAITDYDVRYRVKGAGSGFTDVDHTGTSTSATITGLAVSTTYEVQVRATNDEGTGEWSDSGEGSTRAPNRAPAFPDGATSLDVDENTAAGTAFGDAVTATDPDGDTLAYSLTGADAESFEIDPATGQLKTKAALDYEASQNTYAVTVTASDGTLTDTVLVDIAVNDVDEPPGKPSAPTVAAASEGGSTSLAVSWTAPTNTGPAITDYDVQYRKKGDTGAFADADHTGASTSATLTGLTASTTYEVQVRATNDEGTGVWSDSGEGSTRGPNRAPAFPDGTPSLDVDENTAAGTAFGDAVAATDPDGDTLAYSLTGADAESFEIDSATGQLKTKAALDYEGEKNSYAVTVTASDGSLSDTVSVDITVNDVDEPPGKPSAPTVTASDDGDTTLAVSWAAPSNTGPAITDYDVRYRKKGAGSEFTDADHTGTSTSATLTGLVANTTYEVQVRATNDEGTGEWSDSGEGSTGGPNRAPAFPDGAPSLDVNENTVAGTAFGDAVTATDPDGDTLAYSLSGTDAASFEIDSATGQLKTKAALDYEASQNTYVVTVTASDGSLSDTVSVDIAVNDVDEPPGKPSAPTVTASEDGDTSLVVSWAAPTNTGPAVTDYDVQYRVKGDTGEFTDVDYTGASTSMTLSDLAASTTYEVQVRATNDEGTGEWSDSGEGSTGSSNRAPVFPDEAPTLDVDENTAAGTAFGDAVTATDPDGDTLAYSLTGTDAESFEIDSATGQLKTKAPLDYEAQSSYSVTVTASDGALSADAVVTINVADVNEAPTFPDGAPSLDVNENSAAGTAFGDAVTATDPDGDTLAYSLTGADAASFEIDSATGQLKTKAALDYEASQNTYAVTVTASDGALTDTVLVDIAVNDVDEPPGKPSAPTVEAALENGDTSLVVSWAAPDNAGPAITDYDVQYRVKDAGSEFTSAEHTGAATSVTLFDLSLSTTYEAQVRATNDEGTGAWSASGEGSTSAPNRAPVFPEDALSLDVDENTTAGAPFGDAVTATDPDGDPLAYSLSGADAASFEIETESGQLTVKAPLDYETRSSYSVTVTASDGALSATIAVSIMVTDVDEPPEKPAAPTVRAPSNGDTTSLTISWTPPSTTGPAIADYDIQYREKDGAGDFIGADHSGTHTTATLTGLTEGTMYEVQIRASNDEGAGPWSDSGEGRTAAPNTPPVFPEGPSTTRSVPENSPVETAVGAPVSATDPDPGDTLTYSLSGADAALFAIDESSGQLQTQSVFDYEERDSYAVTAHVDDGFVTASIEVTDVNEAPVFEDGSPTLDVDENEPAGAAVGDPVTATDPDGDSLAYSLSGVDASWFRIDSETGQISTAALFDYEGPQNRSP